MSAGSLIVDQGQTGREAFIACRLVVVERNGEKVGSFGPGTVVGDLSLLDHGPRTATVICESDCELLLLDQRHFIGVIDDVPALAPRAARRARRPHPRSRPPELRLTDPFVRRRGGCST